MVGREEIVKGYEFAKDQYVMFTPAELRELEAAGTHSVDIAQFVPLAAVDPMYFRASGRCAVGRWASHGRDHVVILRPLDNALALHQLHFAPEAGRLPSPSRVRHLGETSST